MNIKAEPYRVPQKGSGPTQDACKGSRFCKYLTNKEIVRTTNENIGKLEIINEEFDGNQLDFLSLELVVFYIEYEIKQKIKCN